MRDPESTRARSAVTLGLLSLGVFAAGDGIAHGVRDGGAIAAAFGPTVRVVLLAGSIAALLACVVALSAVSRRGVPRLAPPLRALFCALVLAAAFQFALLQPYKARTAHIALGLGFGAWGGLLMAAPYVPRRLSAALDVALMNACVIAVLGEVSLRVAAVVRPSRLLSIADSPAGRIRAFRLPPGSIYFGAPVNSQGFYDGEPPATRPLVVSIGDSFGFGIVPHAYHFTTVAERAQPGVSVYNMGIAAIGPPEYRWLLEREAMPLRPDAVVVMLFLGNDIGQANPSPGPLQLLLDRDNLLLFQAPRRLARVHDERRRQEAEAGMDGEGATSLKTKAYRDERLTGDAVVQAFPWLEDPALEPPSYSAERFLEIESRVASMTCAGPAPRMFAEFTAELARIRAVARGTPLLFVLIPDEMQVNDDLWGEVLARSEEPLDRDLAQRAVGAWLSREGIPYLDLLPAMRAAPPLADGRRHLYHLRNTHWNARGNRVAGEEIARAIAPLLRPR